MRAALLLVLIGCDVGTLPSSSPSDASPQADAAAPGVPHTLSVTFTTSKATGNYDPRNIVAVWIEGAGGTFVKTIGRWSDVRTASLLAWNMASGFDSDAVPGATRTAHLPPLTVTWDLEDRQAATVADGTYTIRMELADTNASSQSQNNQGTFTFAKGPAVDSQQGMSNGGFLDVSILFTP
jgi:hypothetical protein